MTKWNLIFDAARCNSCNNCVLATKDEYLDNRFEGYSEPAPRQGNLWFKLRRHERGAAPMIDVTHFVETCRQCPDAPCITGATSDVISARKDGIVTIDPVKAKGRRDLVEACPYGQIYWNDELELPQKYSLDAHLLDSGWAVPRAVQVCPTEALTAVKLDDDAMQARVEKEGLVTLLPGEGRSRLWFRNCERITHEFLGGTLVRVAGDSEDCVEGMAVRLLGDDFGTLETRSDAFGDFKFDNLEAGNTYRLQVVGDDQSILFDREFAVNESQWVGLIEVP